ASGYTLFVADLHGYAIPSFNYTEYQNYIAICRPCAAHAVDAHYYNRTITDPDLGLKLTRHFMTGWGGSSRFYYMDLSAGPSYWTNELPVQVASQLRGISTNTYYGKLWMSKFIGAYVYGAVNNLFAPDQLYPVNYAQNYNVQLFVLDNRTTAEKLQGPKLTATINETMIQENLASLVPFAGVTVKINYTFGVPVKEDIGSPSLYGTFGGEALGDMVLIGFSQQADFTIGNNSTYSQPGKGAGFTHAATHELGHMMGLNHPFIYDLTE